MKHATLLGLLGAALVCVAGCHDGTVGAPPADTGTVMPRGSTQAIIQEDTTARDGTITFVVRVLTHDVTISSFQGAVTFTPGAFTLVSATTPQGQAGENYVLNPAGFSDGRIRFAALTTTKFIGTETSDGVEAMRFTVRALRPVADAGLLATLDVVGSDAGKALAAERVFPSPAVKMASRSAQ